MCVECAVIGVADDARGQIVQAHVVLADGVEPSDETVVQLQEHVKSTIAPFKYPRSIVFIDALPKTADRQDPTLPPSRAAVAPFGDDLAGEAQSSEQS